MLKKYANLLPVCLMSLLLVASVALAQQAGSQHQQHQTQAPAGQTTQPGMMGHGMMGGGMGMMGVDPAKMQQIQKIVAEYQPKLFQLRQDLYTRKAELNAALAQAQPDVSKAKNIAKQIADLQGQQLMQMVEMRARITKETGIRMPMKGMGMGMGGMGGGMMGGMGMGGGMGCPMMQGMSGGMAAMPSLEDDGQ